ncbi:MAG: phosphodiester glycosidase family protein, partial [Clostridia bacterium]|nr:phosphodiester glycosidase family protein [Clostridia bacterium]
MAKRVSRRLLALLLAMIMTIGIAPMPIFAEGETTVDTTEETSVTDYTDFMTKFKQLEIYADEYAAAVRRDAGELVLNFIRTGVERYQDDNWTTLAGQEIIGFTNYVKDQDAKTVAGEEGYASNVKDVMSLRNIVISDFKLPNGNKVDFGHMFGCMNISYVAAGSADLSGWAGDLCDLLQYSLANIDDINANTDGTLESMVPYIQKHCFGVDASGAFGWDDFWGDMDAYYLISEYQKAKGETKFSTLMDSYFGTKEAPSALDDTVRTVYFMNNRFAVADSKEAVRKAIYEAYTADVGISILEAKRGLSSYGTLRQACCYAVADYIYENAQGKLIEGTVSGDVATNGYYSVFSNEHSILAPGIEQDIKYAQTVDGKQIVYYVATVDVTREDVDILVNYNNNAAPVGQNIGLQSVREQVEALIENNKDKENFYPIVATNGAGYNITNGTPGGLVVMQGVEYYPVGAPGFFAILKDGTAVIGDQAKYAELKAEGKVKEAIQAFGSVLVKDGKINVTKSANYTANRASRIAVGITEDGKVVMMVLDGRQLPRSAGGSMEEIAQIMLEAGCVQAVNLDGGGSTTYLSKPAGEDEIRLVNVPSDGYERRVSTSLVAVSTAAPSTAFDSAIISSDYEYITAGTSMQFSVTGVSNTGNAAVIPEGAYWKTSDANIGTIDENGVFTAAATGDVTVQFIVNEVVEGEKVIHVVIPDDIKFAEDRITAIYGEPKDIGVTVWYQGYPVAFTPLVDAIVLFADTEDLVSDAGTIDGMTFTGDDTKGIRTANVIAVVATADSEIIKFGSINLYYKDEATFDFANATQGNRSFAWIREIENARTLDNQLYRISDPDSPVVIDYTFALDMTAIDFPPQLEPMKSMLPTYSENSTAWDYLLQLAERVCTQTQVTIRAEFSRDLEVDISKLKILTEYFTAAPEDINLDANNVLTIKCHWVNQSQPIDPAT